MSSQLPPDEPTSTRLLRECPRFCVLIVGNAGVGKSTLVNKVFQVDVDLANVSGATRGKADIDKPITHDANKLFVLHDSLGIERGNRSNLDQILQFVKQRSSGGVKLKDRVHAIWFCVATPYDGSRIFEQGLEELIQIALTYKVPMVVVFTKHDLLFLHLRERLKRSNPTVSDEQLTEQVNRQADELTKRYTEEYVKKFDNAPPHIFVSDRRDDGALKKLVAITITHTRQSSTAEAWLICSMAQRVSAAQHIEASVEIGMRGYWDALLIQIVQWDRPFFRILDVIHSDIVATWNILGGIPVLEEEDFRKVIRTFALSRQPRIVQGETMTAQDANTIASLLEPLSEVFKVFIPIAWITVKTGVWLQEKYSQTPENKRVVLEYIVHLTLILESFFWDKADQRKGLSLDRHISQEELRDMCRQYEKTKMDSTAKQVSLLVDSTSLAAGAKDVRRDIEKLIFKNTEIDYSGFNT